MGLDRAQKKRLREDGYAVLRGAVSKPLIDAALRVINHRLGPGAHRQTDTCREEPEYKTDHSGEPAVLALLNESGLFAAAESLLGDGRVLPAEQAQVALRFPARDGSLPAYVGAHVDGLSGDRPDGKIERFTLCVGILLNDLPAGDMGNLMLYPGTHRLLADYVKKHGPSFPVEGPRAVIALPKPVPFTGKAGDAILMHYQLVHDKTSNLSPHIRYMAYFRLYHASAWKNDSKEYLRQALTDLWLEWPGLAAAPKRAARRKA